MFNQDLLERAEWWLDELAWSQKNYEDYRDRLKLYEVAAVVLESIEICRLAFQEAKARLLEA